MTRAITTLSAALFLIGCEGDREEVGIIQFDESVTIVSYVSSSGGALGDEEYEVAYRHKGRERTFFKGVNPRRFSVAKEAGSVLVEFCLGKVNLAEPIFLEAPRSELIPLELAMDCSDDKDNKVST